MPTSCCSPTSPKTSVASWSGRTIRGAVRVAERSRLIDCVVTGPAVIGAGCQSHQGHGRAQHLDRRLLPALGRRSGRLDHHGGRRGPRLADRNSLLGRDSRHPWDGAVGFVEMTLGEKSEIFGE